MHLGRLLPGAEISLVVQVFIGAAMGSTNVAKNNWPEYAAGLAISGVPMAIGENVTGMDMNSQFANGKVVSGPELKWRVDCYRDWQLDGFGEVILQANVEDTMWRSSCRCTSEPPLA